MVNFRKINDDILKKWFNFREETCFCYADKQDRENYIYNQLNLIYDIFIRYLTYITEKYYRNEFVNSSQLVMGCFDE